MKNLLGLIMLVVGLLAFFVADAVAVTLFAIYFVVAGLISLFGEVGSAENKE